MSYEILKTELHKLEEAYINASSKLFDSIYLGYTVDSIEDQPKPLQPGFSLDAIHDSLAHNSMYFLKLAEKEISLQTQKGWVDKHESILVQLFEHEKQEPIKILCVQFLSMIVHNGNFNRLPDFVSYAKKIQNKILNHAVMRMLQSYVVKKSASFKQILLLT